PSAGRRLLLTPGGLYQQSARLSVGLEVHAPDHLIAKEEGKSVVAVLALRSGRVYLDAVLHGEHALEPVAEPHGRVEGGEQGGPRGPFRVLGLAGEQRRLLPAFDLHPPRDAAFDGRVGKRLRLGEKPDAEVIRDVRDRAYPVGAQSVVEQFLLSLTPGKGWQPVGISPDPARVAVRPLEVLPGRHGDAPGEEQVLEGPLRSAPIPPGAAFTVRGRLQ